MKNLAFRESISFISGGCKVVRREYLKMVNGRPTFDKRFKYEKFKSHDDAKSALSLLDDMDLIKYRYGVEPLDSLNYAVIS